MWGAHRIGLLDRYGSPTKCKKVRSCDTYDLTGIRLSCHLRKFCLIQSFQRILSVTLSSKEIETTNTHTYTRLVRAQAGTDPGLVIEGGHQPLVEGTPTQYIYTFSEKPHEIKEILVRRGGTYRERPPP